MGAHPCFPPQGYKGSNDCPNSRHFIARFKLCSAHIQIKFLSNIILNCLISYNKPHTHEETLKSRQEAYEYFENELIMNYNTSLIN